GWPGVSRIALIARTLADGREQLAVTLDALERMTAAILEANTGPGAQIAHGARHEDLIRTRQRADARGHDDVDPTEGLARAFHLARVHPGPRPQTEGAVRPLDLGRAADRARGPVERREEAGA